MWQRKKILRTAGIAFLVLLAGAGAFTLYLDHRVRTEFEGRRFALPARIYARPLELHAGQRLALPDLEDELRELGYKALIEKPDPAREAEGGWYVRSGERLDVGLRAFVFWDGPQPARQVRLAFDGGAVSALTDTEGRVALPNLRRMRRTRALKLLTGLPGVGRKTASCVLLFGAHVAAIPVDTHVHRVSRRLGLVPDKADAVTTQELLQAEIAPPDVYDLHMLLIRHGREVCIARRPFCSRCPVSALCPRVGVVGAR